MGAEEGVRALSIEGIERNKREEEERRGKKVEVLPNRDCNQPLHHSSFGVLRLSFG